MVGFKSIWLLITLLLFAACVPQTKQTECSSNEAFNAQLRTCVPVVNGPSSFIDIQSYSPTVPLVKGMGDGTSMSFSVVITNPYAQAYTVVWERIFNGVTYSISPTSPTMHSFTPASLGTQIGTHVIAVKIKDSSNNIVDSHNFTLVLNSAPKPVIQSGTVNPALYSSTFTPSQLPVTFSFDVYNNLATMGPVGNYRVDWNVYRSGVSIDTDTFIFPDNSSGGTNYPTYLFDPNAIDGVEVGDYIIRGRVTNLALEVVAEQQWSVTVNHPPLSKVMLRDIYTGGGIPHTNVTTAYNGVPYTTSPTLNFIPALGVAQGDYCVTVASGEGTYASDGLFVRVDYYLDGNTLIYSGLTTAGDPQVCMSDASALVEAGIVFNNATPTVAQTHTLVARVIDEATGQEYTGTSADTIPGKGPYPFAWTFTVKPTNAAPTVAFYSPTGSTAACTPSTATNNNCTVTQGTTFTVGLTVSDDFYNSFPANDNRYSYSFQLMKGTTPMTGTLSSCTKTTAQISANQDVTGVGDFTGPNFVCSLRVPHFDPTTMQALNPNSSFSVVATVTDNGSPIVATPMTSTQMVWSLTVNETTTAPAIAPFSVASAYMGGTNTAIYQNSTLTQPSPIPENETLRFKVLVTDAEGDNFTVSVDQHTCIDLPGAVTSACATTSNIYTSPVIVNDAGSAAKVHEFTFNNLSSQIVIGDPALASCGGVAETPAGCQMRIFFKVNVTEVTHGVAALSAPTVNGFTNLSNVNPAPTLSALATPSNASPLYVMTGMPITLDAGTVNDSSLGGENTITYQWYVKTNSGAVGTYTAIPGATSEILTWTPGIRTTPFTEQLNVKVCFSDGTNTYPLSGTVPRCSTAWNIRPWNHLYDLGANPGTGDTAVIQDSADASTFFSAIESSGNIVLNKTSLDSTTAYSSGFTPYNGSFATLSIPAADISSGFAANTINDLSLASTTNSLLVAYRLEHTASPGTYSISIRNINKRINGAEGKNNTTTNDALTTRYDNNGKFGFNYSGINLDLNSMTAAGIDTDCDGYASGSCDSPTYLTRGTAPFLDLSAAVGGLAPVDGDTILVNAVPITFTSAVVGAGLTDANIANREICLVCTTITQATQIATIINNSASSIPEWQGITATNSGSSIVRFNGSLADDKLDYVTNQPVDMGNIALDGSPTPNWYIPFINGSLGGSNQYKIGVLYGATPGINGVITATPSGPTNLLTTAPATVIASTSTGSVMYVAAINLTGSTLSLYRFTYGGGTVNHLHTASPFASNSGFVDVRIAPPVGAVNPYVSVLAKDTLNRWWYGRYNASDLTFTAADEFQLVSKASVATAPLLTLTDVSDIQMSSFASGATPLHETRLVVTSRNVATPSYYTYMLRVQYDSGAGDYTVKCDHLASATCRPLASFNVPTAAKVGVIPSSTVSQPIGSIGAVAAENDKPLTVAVVPRSATSDAVLMLLNGKNENIQATGTDSTNFWWHPAFIAD